MYKYYLFAVISVLLNATAQIVLKTGATKTMSVSDLVFKSAFLVATGSLYLLSILTWFLALRQLPLAITYPLQALGYIFIAFYASFYLKESISFVSALGLITIFLGLVLLQFGSK
jgi:undecaprenyl phosphate-alpha-L-ara4N flippase subunit ArnF